MARTTTFDWVILTVIILTTVGLRLFLALQVPYVVGEESVHWQRQIHDLRENQEIGNIDELYAGKRQVSTFPLFAYLLAFISPLGQQELVGKIVTNLLASSIVLIVFFLTKNLTDKSYVRYLVSFFAGLIPIFIQQTVHIISIYSIIIPLFVWCIHCFIQVTKAKKKSFAGWFAASLILYSALHPSVLVFVAGLLVYIIILKVEQLKITNAELELVVFSLIVAPIMQVIIYRELLLAHGVDLIWQNLPEQIVGNYFTDITLLEAFYKIGEIPVIFGLIIIAKYLFKEKDKQVSLLVSFALVVSAALYFKLIPPPAGMMFLGAVLVLLFTFYYTLYLNFIPSTKFEKLLPILKMFLFITFILTSIIPAYNLVQDQIEETQYYKHQPALDWMVKNTDEGAIFVSHPSLGHKITTANRSIIADNNFLFVDDAQKRLDDIDRIFTNPYQSTVLDIMKEYRAEYLYIDKEFLKKQYNRSELRFLPGYLSTDCFETVFHEEIVLVKRTCTLKLVQ